VFLSPDYDPTRVDAATRLTIEATNIGRRPVTLNAGGLRYKDATLGVFAGDKADKTYPIRLKEGQSGSTWTYLVELRDSLLGNPNNFPARGFFRSEADKIYSTKLSKVVVRALRKP